MRNERKNALPVGYCKLVIAVRYERKEPTESTGKCEGYLIFTLGLPNKCKQAHAAGVGYFSCTAMFAL